MTPADLAGALAQGGQAAFHGRPGDGIDLLERAAQASPEGPQGGMIRWLLAVCLGASGRYREAWDALEPVLSGTMPSAGDRLTAALAASCSASLHRQLGDHRTAQVLDDQGLAWSEPLGVAAIDAIVDCSVGLTADAVGLDDLVTARERLTTVEQLIASAGHNARWRARVRAAWVRSEVALLSGDARSAEAAAVGAIEIAQAAQAPRHVAKSQLFLGVAQATLGAPEAAATLRASASAAQALGCVPLVWPARAVLAAVLPPGPESAAALDSARSIIDALAQDLPEDIRATWLSRPDIVALHSG